jgi:threonine dehydrogenase-like Zn-dependent dehydrogenase
MQHAIVSGVRQAALVETTNPLPVENWVVVKVHAAPMCTEYKTLLAGTRNPVIGHEAAGEVVAVAQPGRMNVGDRVVAMPLYGYGRCPACRSGDYIHCQQQPDFTAATRQVNGLGWHNTFSSRIGC